MAVKSCIQLAANNRSIIQNTDITYTRRKPLNKMQQIVKVLHAVAGQITMDRETDRQAEYVCVEGVSKRHTYVRKSCANFNFTSYSGHESSLTLLRAVCHKLLLLLFSVASIFIFSLCVPR